MAIYASNIGNMVLFVAKVYASIESRSLAVIASTLDSLLDLLSGFILWFTAYAMRKPNHHQYPIGKNRMQPVVTVFYFFHLEHSHFGNTLISSYIFIVLHLRSFCWIDPLPLLLHIYAVPNMHEKGT